MNTRIKIKGARGIGIVIKNGCLERGIHQKDLAAMVGVRPNTISEYVRGVTVPNKKIVAIIEEKLGLRSGHIESMIVREEDDDKTRYRPSKEERRILKAWKYGELSPIEVQKETGYSMQVISRYLPVNEDAQYVDC